MKIAIGLEYSGAAYFGWQTQPHATSIQSIVETALSEVADEPVSVICAGRTDAGVHALQQVIHLETGKQREAKAWVFGGNVHLPMDISLLWAKPVSDEFHARFSATGRRYQYLILNRPTRPGILGKLITWEYRPLDVELMHKAADCLIGEHDFSSFRDSQCQAKSPVRTVKRLEIRRLNDCIVLDIAANAFLHHMVRNIAGVLMAIGAGKEPVTWAQQVLESRDRRLGGVTAPPDGLYLKNIEYPEHFGIPNQGGPDWPVML